jgi:hypothetical protein
MYYKGVLVNNLLYSRKYLLSYNILYSKKDNFLFVKDAVTTLQKEWTNFGVNLVYPRSLVLKYFFKTFEIENILDFSKIFLCLQNACKY